LAEINTREARSRGLRGPLARSRVRLYLPKYVHKVRGDPGSRAV